MNSSLPFTPFFILGIANTKIEKGACFPYTMYDKNGKLDGTSDYKATSVLNSGGKTVAEMTINIKLQER